MLNKKLYDRLGYVMYICMALFVLMTAYIVFFENDNFCVTAGGQADLDDLGTHCFRTVSESNEFKLYLIEKYDLDKEKELNYDLNVSLNISK